MKKFLSVVILMVASSVWGAEKELSPDFGTVRFDVGKESTIYESNFKIGATLEEKMGAGGRSGRVNLTPVTLVRRMDATTLDLLGLVGQLKPTKATIQINDGVSKTGIRIELQEAFITDIEFFRKTDEAKVTYERITLDYARVIVDLGVGKPFCYDAKSKKGC